MMQKQDAVESIEIKSYQAWAIWFVGMFLGSELSGFWFYAWPTLLTVITFLLWFRFHPAEQYILLSEKYAVMKSAPRFSFPWISIILNYGVGLVGWWGFADTYFPTAHLATASFWFYTIWTVTAILFAIYRFRMNLWHL